jgi:hypothetical protein
LSDSSSVKELSGVSPEVELQKDKPLEKSESVPLPEIQSSKRISSSSKSESPSEKGISQVEASGNLKSDKG